jgi:signal transduction histidine kinase
VHLFRIAQEALNNIHKHANASSVNIRLELREDVVILSIEDDGKGFDLGTSQRAESRDHGMGLLGMQERAVLMRGTLDIRSRNSGGTTVTVRVPRVENVAG